MLINLLRDEQPSHIAVAFDVSRKTFRGEMYAEYKARSQRTPDEFNGQDRHPKRCSTRWAYRC